MTILGGIDKLARFLLLKTILIKESILKEDFNKDFNSLLYRDNKERW
jgi:hypothetical protein